MGTIKDIVDLSAQLINSVKDRKIISDLNAIQSLISQLQSEQSTISERNTDLKQQLFTLKNEFAKVEKEHTNLAKKCSELEKEVSRLREQLDKKTVSPEFTEKLGAFFKRDASGSYTPIAYCPKCKNPLFCTNPSIFPYMCNTPGCNYVINIHKDLQSIVDQLNKETS